MKNRKKWVLQLYANELANLNEVESFLGKDTLPSLTEEAVEKLN